MFELNNHMIWAVEILGIIIIIAASTTLISSLLLADKVRENILENKCITVKGTVYSKKKEYLNMGIIILISNRYKVPMIMFTEEDYNKHIEGDTLFLSINSTGSIELITNLSQ